MNIPDDACLFTSECIQKLVTDLTGNDVLITLTSGRLNPIIQTLHPLLQVKHNTRLLVTGE